MTSSGGSCSARMTNTVLAGGSSSTFSSTDAASRTRWKSTRSRTFRDPSLGERMARRRTSRAWSTEIDAPERSTTTTSGCTPANARRHTSHSPHPPRGHSRAAPRATAAVRLPDPGGPTSR